MHTSQNSTTRCVTWCIKQADWLIQTTAWLPGSVIQVYSLLIDYDQLVIPSLRGRKSQSKPFSSMLTNLDSVSRIHLCLQNSLEDLRLRDNLLTHALSLYIYIHTSFNLSRSLSLSQKKSLAMHLQAQAALWHLCEVERATEGSRFYS